MTKPFVISRGTRVETEVIKVTISDGKYAGVGEGVPTPHYGESLSSVLDQVDSIQAASVRQFSRQNLLRLLPPGSARNALDAALWDLEAKQLAQNVGQLSGLGWPTRINSAQTVCIDTSTKMGRAAAKLKRHPVIKIKLDQSEILARVAAVRANAPNATLLVDANESWSLETLADTAPALRDMGVAMIEQPLPAASDEGLSKYVSPLPLYADESCHTRADLPGLRGKYQGINIKLDKSGGLTEAIELWREGTAQGFEVMVGCMLSTSLGIAPALFLANHIDYVDLDAPTLLASDRNQGLAIKDGRIDELSSRLWGGMQRDS